jgi:hypothetical protein
MPLTFMFVSTLMPFGTAPLMAGLLPTTYLIAPETMRRFYEWSLYKTRRFRRNEGLGLADMEERYLMHRPHLTFHWLSSRIGAYPNLPGISRKDLLSGIEILDKWMARQVLGSTKFGDIDKLHTSLFDRYLEVSGDPLGFEPEYNWTYMFLHPALVGYFSESVKPIYRIRDPIPEDFGGLIKRAVAKFPRSLRPALIWSSESLINNVSGLASTIHYTTNRAIGNNVVCPICGSLKPRGAACPVCGFRSSSDVL